MKVILLSVFIAGTAAAELKLHTSTTTHLHATYKGLAVEIKHLGDRSGISRLYDAETGENFLQVKNIDGEVKMQYFDHPADELKHGEAPENYGALLDEFDEHPKLALLEEMSKSFEGTDAQHEVSHWFHRVALSRTKRLSQAQDAVLLGEEEHEQVGWGSRRRRRRRMRSISSPINKCKNACFGLCGNDCNCWSIVCGDCSAHQGCWEHDCYCSCKGMWNGRCIAFMANGDTCNWPSCAASYCGKSAIDSC